MVDDVAVEEQKENGIWGRLEKETVTYCEHTVFFWMQLRMGRQHLQVCGTEMLVVVFKAGVIGGVALTKISFVADRSTFPLRGRI